jgi:hypothetical protein
VRGLIPASPTSVMVLATVFSETCSPAARGNPGRTVRLTRAAVMVDDLHGQIVPSLLSVG